MPAKDLYHDAVKAALIKDGWLILADPYRIQYKDIDDITYENFFKREGIGFIIRTSQIFLLVVNIDLQEIVQWIS